MRENEPPIEMYPGTVWYTGNWQFVDEELPGLAYISYLCSGGPEGDHDACDGDGCECYCHG